jgi:diaminopimelate epimerase
MLNPIRINFSKMQALGNDFMVISSRDQNFSLSKQQIQALSHRHLGVGFDQLLVIKPPLSSKYDYFYQIFNADGHEVGQCGNGARCVAKYIHQHLSPLPKIRLETLTTSMNVEMISEDSFALTLAKAKYAPQDIPMLKTKQAAIYELKLESGEITQFHCINVGNPHTIILMNSLKELEELQITNLGPLIEQHPCFPEGCNVNFMAIQDHQNIHLRVWERGCKETLACGSGALASAVIARKFYHLDAKIEVHLPGGNLTIICENPEEELVLIGPAHEVFTGQIDLIY